MEYKKITSKGGLNIPIKLRREMGIENGDPMEIEVNDQNNLVISAYNPRCIFCGSQEIIIRQNGKGICQNCLNQLTERKI